MNYSRIYTQIVARANSENRIKTPDNYYELHHINPRCIGGDNVNSNLVLLTAREHFICHWLLVRMYPKNKKLAYAFYAMCNLKGRGQADRIIPTSRVYQEAKHNLRVRPEHTEYLKNTFWTVERKASFRGDNHPMKKEENKQKLRGDNHPSKKQYTKEKWKEAWNTERKASWTGINNPMYGKTGKDHHNARKVQDVVTGEVFDSLTQAGVHYGIGKSAVHARIAKQQGLRYL